MGRESTERFFDLVKKAYEGQLRLPAFQREFKWKHKKIKALYDSLLRKFPIGSFFLIKQLEQSQRHEIDFCPRQFTYHCPGGAGDNEGRGSCELVLDGQQRLTAGIVLFHDGAENDEGQLWDYQYFLDLMEIGKLLERAEINLADWSPQPTADAAERDGIKRRIEGEFRRFLSTIDVEDDAYIVHKPNDIGFEKRLLREHLWPVFSFLDDEEWDRLKGKYVERHPDKEALVRHVIRKFRPADIDIPFTTIPPETGIESVCRLFTALNTQGQILKPYELVVAKLYPTGIRLMDEFKRQHDESKYLQRMEKRQQTGSPALKAVERFLQTIVMLDKKEEICSGSGADVPQKTGRLPKTINKENYEQYKVKAVEILEKLGKWLTEELGLGLDESSKLVHHSPIYVPMSIVLSKVPDGMTGVAYSRLKKWFVGAQLLNRYGDSAHTRQSEDLKQCLPWVLGETNEEPAWLSQSSVPSLVRVKPGISAGKLFLCFLNKGKPLDPLTRKDVGYREGAEPTEKHHIFPKKWMRNLHNWNGDKGEYAMNLMLVSKATNNIWLNTDPKDQFQQAVTELESEEEAKSVYKKQFIEGDCLTVMRKPDKTMADFERFLDLRAQSFRRQNLDEYRFEFTDRDAEDDESDDEDDGE